MYSVVESVKQAASGVNVYVIGGILLLFVCLVVYFKYFYNNKPTFYANRENVPKNVDSNKTATLMLFYADWCPHCKNAKPEWDSLKNEYDQNQINGYTMSFVEYDCSEETAEMSEIINKYNIESFPTIKLIKDNEIIEYDAKPTKSTMVQFLTTVL
jgi:thiol-disulfide isomerase/thioredoxin